MEDLNEEPQTLRNKKSRERMSGRGEEKRQLRLGICGLVA